MRPDLASVIAVVVARLPLHHRAALKAVVFEVLPELPGKPYARADAGGGRVRLRSDLVEELGHGAACAVVAHELAHELHGHQELLGLDNTRQTRDLLEELADQQAAQWLGPGALVALRQARRP